MIFEFDCKVCGKQMRVRRSPANLNGKTPKFCSQRCNGIGRLGSGSGPQPNVQFACKHCGTMVIAYRSPSSLAKAQPKFCSLECLGEAQKGEANPAFSGGRHLGANGYIYSLAPDHPRANVRGYVLEHRLVAEHSLGRLLTECEVVHHIDGNRLNNSPDNLHVFASQSEHSKHHVAERRESC